MNLDAFTYALIIELIGHYAALVSDLALKRLISQLSQSRARGIVNRLKQTARKFTFAKQVLAAGERAGECFITRCNNDEVLASLEKMAPLSGTWSLKQALLNAEDFVTEKELRRVISELFSKTWPNLTTYQLEKATHLYFGCLKDALKTLPGYGERLVRWEISRIYEAVDPQKFERILKDYQRAIGVFCKTFPYLALEDYLGKDRPPFEELYVPLKAKTKAGETLKGKPVNISEVFRKVSHLHPPPQILILGQPGAGKSTLLRQLALHAFEKPESMGLSKPYLPIIVSMQSLALAPGGSIESRFINSLEIAGELLLEEGFPAGFIKKWSQLTDQKWLFLLDGWDEVPEGKRIKFTQWIIKLFKIAQSRGYQVVLTSRLTGNVAALVDENFAVYELLPFTKTQQRKFAQNWFGRKARSFLKELERVETNQLSGTPLLLTISAAVFHKDPNHKLPQKRVDLYERFVTIWIDEAKRRGLREELPDDLIDFARPILEHLAFEMTIKPDLETIFDLGIVAEKFLANELGYPSQKARLYGGSLINSLGKHSGIFVYRNNVGRWIHPTFREYLVAQKIAHDIRRFKGETLGKMFWVYEISMFLRQLLDKEDANVILNMIENETSDPGTRFQAVVLAGQLHINEARSMLENLRKQKNLDHKLLREVYISLALLGNQEAAFEYVELCKQNFIQAERNKTYTQDYFYDVKDTTRALVRHIEEDYYRDRKPLEIFTAGQVAGLDAISHLQKIIDNAKEDPRNVQLAMEAIESIKTRYQL